MMVPVKIIFHIIGKKEVFKVQCFFNIWKIIYALLFIACNYLLETGNIRIIPVNKIEHSLFCFGMVLSMLNIELLHIPTHNPKAAGFFLHGKGGRKINRKNIDYR